jgi:hypothetical protein
MLIRVSGAKIGIKEYLEKGHKQGREHSRDELDERVILAGDLDFTNQLINDMDVDGERYLHITLAFKEDKLSEEVLRNITEDFRKFAFAAYDEGEYNFYAEAHLPKIKSYVSQRTGELVERKPHIHIVIPKTNLLSRGFLNPLGMVEHNERYIDAFQEHINNKYGLASPKDNRRIEFTNASDMIQRYRDDYFDGQSKELKKDILAAVLGRQVTDYTHFAQLVAEFGTTRTRNADKDGAYLNVKVDGSAKGVNLKDYVFTRAFIELPDADKRERLSAEIQRKYEIEGESRKNPVTVQAGLNDWFQYRANEVKYLNSGNKRLYERYRSASPEERQLILAELAKKFYDKYQEPRHEPERFTGKNPFDHAYGYKRPAREVRGPAIDGAGRGPSGHELGVDGADVGRGPGRLPSGPGMAGNGISSDGGPGGRWGHPGFGADRKHDAVSLRAVEKTRTIHSVRGVPGGRVVRESGKGAMLLSHPAPSQLGNRGDRSNPDLRRPGHRQRIGATGRANDSAVSQLVRDFDQRQQVETASTLAEFKDIKLRLDATRLLAELSRSHGVIIDKYQVSTAPDGSARIRCGTRNLNVSDFLTKEMRLPWAESAAILRLAYDRQLDRHPSLVPRVAPSRTLWRQFQDARREHGGPRESLRKQLDSERTRLAALRRDLEDARRGAEALSPAGRKAAQSVARTEYVIGEAALKTAFRAERAKFRAPISEQYQTFLQGRAQVGDDAALIELRRMSKSAPQRENPTLGYIGPANAQDEPNGLFYRGKQVRYLVHQNGDVVYSLGGRAIIMDKGDKFLMLQTDRQAVEMALRLAHERFGGVLTLSGTADFQERAARIAAESGLQVTFENKRAERIRQDRASELASERAKRAEHFEAGSQFVENRTKVRPPVVPEPAKDNERSQPGSGKPPAPSQDLDLER